MERITGIWTPHFACARQIQSLVDEVLRICKRGDERLFCIFGVRSVKTVQRKRGTRCIPLFWKMIILKYNMVWCKRNFSLILYAFFFQSLYGGNKHTSDCTAIVLDRFIGLFVHIPGFKQQFKPIFGLKYFFQRYFKFRNKAFCALRVLRFVNIRADRGTASEQLICQHGFMMFLFDCFAKKNNLFCKFFGFVSKNAVRQWYHLECYALRAVILFLVILPPLAAVILSLRDSYIFRLREKWYYIRLAHFKLRGAQYNSQSEYNWAKPNITRRRRI